LEEVIVLLSLQPLDLNRDTAPSSAEVMKKTAPGQGKTEKP
jgi:hypothetical protein